MASLDTRPGETGATRDERPWDPLADFFKVWGEGGELYQGEGASVETSFAGKDGEYVSDLAGIVEHDNAFATCTVQNVWEWLMGRGFYTSEEELRKMLTTYFQATRYSFSELVFAVATHPAFMVHDRSDGVVTDPLEEPPMGEISGTFERECKTGVTYADDVSAKISECTSCHGPSNSPRIDLSSESAWREHGDTAVGMMASGSMPPGQTGPPFSGDIFDLKERVRCWLEQAQ